MRASLSARSDEVCGGLPRTSSKVSKLPPRLSHLVPLIILSCSAAAFKPEEEEEDQRGVSLAKLVENGSFLSSKSNQPSSSLFPNKVWLSFEALARTWSRPRRVRDMKANELRS